jgi:hypothetical protein
MAESVILLASVAVDGRPVRCEHAVLLSEAAPSSWLIALLGVADRDLDQLAGRHVASLVDTQGRLLQGTVEVAAGQLHSHVRLEGAGRLLELVPAAAEPVPHSYALLTRNV